MYSHFLDNKGYVVTKTCLWFALFVAAGIDWIVHRYDMAQGYQLHRAIFACLSVFVIRDVVTTIYIYASDEPGFQVDLVMKILFHLGESTFMLLLMVIASGWKTTRSTLGMRLRFVVVAPIASLISSVFADYFLLKEAALQVDNELAHLERTQTLGFEIALAISMFAYVCIWIWIFQAVKVEQVTLEAKIYGISLENTADPLTGQRLETDLDASDNLPGQAEDESQTTTRIHNNDHEDDHESPSNVSRISLDGDGNEHLASGMEGSSSITDQPTMDTESSLSPPSYSAAIMSEEDRNFLSTRVIHTSEDEPLPEMDDMEDIDTAEDDKDKALMQMPLKAKLRMAVRLKWAVTLYVVMILIKFFYSAFKQTSSDVLTVFMDIILVGLMSFLIWSYRLRKQNPYYMLEDYTEEEQDAHPDGHVRGIPMGGTPPIYVDDDEEENESIGRGVGRFRHSPEEADTDYMEDEEVASFNIALS